MKTRTELVIGELLNSVTLTEKEFEFVDSCAGQYEDKGELSERQMEILEDIYKRDDTRR